MSWTLVSYLYDGTYAGFLTCVFDSFRHREEPADFTPFSEAAASFYPQRAVETHQEKARRGYRSLGQVGRGGEGGGGRGVLPCLGGGGLGVGGVFHDGGVGGGGGGGGGRWAFGGVGGIRGQRRDAGGGGAKA